MIEGINTRKYKQESEFASALATVEQVTPNGLILKIDGEDETRQKEYMCNQSYRFCRGDRVKVSKVSGTYIVEFPIGPPNLFRTVGFECVKQTNGQHTWYDDKYGVTFSQVNYSGVDIRTSNPVDLTDIKEIRFKIWFKTFSDPNGLYIGAVLEKLDSAAPSPWDSSFAAFKKLTSDDTGRRIHTVDVSHLKGQYYICTHAFSQTYDVEGIYLY